jgi:hypothetical protein
MHEAIVAMSVAVQLLCSYSLHLLLVAPAYENTEIASHHPVVTSPVLHDFAWCAGAAKASLAGGNVV